MLTFIDGEPLKARLLLRGSTVDCKIVTLSKGLDLTRFVVPAILYATDRNWSPGLKTRT